MLLICFRGERCRGFSVHFRDLFGLTLCCCLPILCNEWSSQVAIAIEAVLGVGVLMHDAIIIVHLGVLMFVLSCTVPGNCQCF